MAKSPDEVAEHVGPKVPLDTSQIPPVPPLPVVPPMPPLPTAQPAAEGARAEADAQVRTADEVLPNSENVQSAPTESISDAETAPAEATSISDERPPLPALSAEEAALQFETLPDSAEQATGLENHEPMKFVWSKRWPFLSLVPAASGANLKVSAVHPTDAEAEADASVIADPDLQPTSADPSASGDEGIENFFTAPEDADEQSMMDADEVDREVIVEEDVENVADEQIEIEPGPAVPEVPTESFSTPATTAFLETSSQDAEPDRYARADSVATEVLAESSVLVEDITDTESLVDPAHEVVAAPVTRPIGFDGLGDQSGSPVVLSIHNLSRSFGDTIAVDGIDLEVREGSFYGIVGPNGAGKTTTLSMITGLLRPDSGNITVHGIDVWENPDKAKRAIGVLPDRLRLFDRLTGAQLLYYSGVLRGLDGATVRSRVKDLAVAFGLEDALNRLVTDYSAGMTKKVALASAMIHSPRLLVLDEPFESVDPVSAANVIEILQKYVAHGGTVVLSSHGMDLIQRVCDHVAIVVNGQVLAAGAVDDVRGAGTLEDRFVELAGGRKAAEGMEWLHSFSD
jgi:ABC-2 type transport system ATP-binding protein